MPRKKVVIVSILLIVIAGTLSYFLFFRKNAKSVAVYSEVKKSDFKVWIVTTGELRSQVQTNITIPQGLRQIDVYQIKISQLIPEGTLVKKGDFVASLDNADILTKLNDQQLELDKLEAQFTQTTLDTMLNLRSARDELVNLRFDLEQKELEKEQSKYEAPSVIRQVELEYDKAVRTLKQKEDNYRTKQIQARTQMQIIGADLQRRKNRMKAINDVLAQTTISAPKSGMVIYEKSWDGTKRTVGSVLQIWDGGTVATLPDLSKMETVTYVNEVDIQKVRVGQKVDIGLDAAPEKKLQGIVKSVASIGQQKPNSDAKVFEVLINVLTKDSTLRPAMTTSCRILSESYRDGLQIPLEAIYNNKNESYVFKLVNGHPVEQQIKVAAVNEVNALIVNGLKPDDKIYLSLPPDTSGLNMVALNPKDKVPLNPVNTIDSAWVQRHATEEAEETETDKKSGSVRASF